MKCVLEKANRIAYFTNFGMCRKAKEIKTFYPEWKIKSEEKSDSLNT